MQCVFCNAFCLLVSYSASNVGCTRGVSAPPTSPSTVTIAYVGYPWSYLITRRNNYELDPMRERRGGEMCE